MLVSIDDVIDSYGFNKFSFKLILIIGVLWMSESVETNLMSLVGPELRCSWNLSSLQVSMTSSSVFLGSGIGSVCMGYLGDIYGRKKTMIIGAFLTTYFGLLSAVSQNFTWFLIARFFVGIGLGPMPSGSCYIAELMARKHRGKAVVSVDIMYALGSIYVAFVAFLLMRATSWEVFLVASAAPSALFLILSCWLPESIRFLQNAGQYNDLLSILHRISVASGTPMSKMSSIACRSFERRGNISILFNTTYRRQYFVILILFISSFWCYFGIALLNTEILQSGVICNLNHTTKVSSCHLLSNNDYLRNLISVSGEIPGILLPVLVIDILGRKWYTFTNGVLTGIGFLCLNFCSSEKFLGIIMFIMRFVVIGYAQLPYLYASELFPTVVRTTAVGTAIGVTKVTLIGVPYLVQYFAHISFLTTSVVFAVLSFISAILVLTLPETMNQPLPDI